MLEPTVPMCSPVKVPESRQHQRSMLPDRTSTRAIGVAVIAAALVLGTSLYPLPTTSRPLEIAGPQQRESEFPELVQNVVANHRLPKISTREMPDLLHLTELLEVSYLDLRADTVVELVSTYGVAGVVKSLELLVSLQPPTQGLQAEASGGGGGGGGGGGIIDPAIWQDVVLFLRQLIDSVPVVGGQGLETVLKDLLPEVVRALGVPLANAASRLAEAPAPAVPHARPLSMGAPVPAAPRAAVPAPAPAPAAPAPTAPPRSAAPAPIAETPTQVVQVAPPAPVPSAPPVSTESTPTHSPAPIVPDIPKETSDPSPTVEPEPDPPKTVENTPDPKPSEEEEKPKPEDSDPPAGESNSPTGRSESNSPRDEQGTSPNSE